MSTDKVRSTGRPCCVPGCKNTHRDLKFYYFPNGEWETERKKNGLLHCYLDKIDAAQLFIALSLTIHE